MQSASPQAIMSGWPLMKATIPWRSNGCSSTTRIRGFATCSPGGAMLSVACAFGISIRKGLRLASQYACVNWLCSSRIYGSIPCEFFRQSQISCKEKNVAFLQRWGCPVWGARVRAAARGLKKNSAEMQTAYSLHPRLDPTNLGNERPRSKGSLQGKRVTSIVLEHGADCRLRLST